MQPIKELSSAAGRCVGRGCALIRQLANLTRVTVKLNTEQETINVVQWYTNEIIRGFIGNFDGCNGMTMYLL